MPVKLARLLPYITIGFCFDSHPRIDSVLKKPGFATETSEITLYSKKSTSSRLRMNIECRVTFFPIDVSNGPQSLGISPHYPLED
ncbi:MAG: hypothetical protein ACK5GN_00850 [Pseudomonadota bacterium]